MLEPLKSDMLHDWIVEVQEKQLDVLLDCLLPWPAYYSRVGGSWDTHCPKSMHIRVGFNRLFCLVPYEIITVDLWNEVIPRWLQAMVTIVPSDDWIDFRIILQLVSFEFFVCILCLFYSWHQGFCNRPRTALRYF